MLRPMLACNKIIPFEDLHFPLIASEKLNGIRCLVFPNEEICTRSGKIFPNVNVPKILKEVCNIANKEQRVFDGELFSRTSTWSEHLHTIMSEQNPLPTDLQLFCFDTVGVEDWNKGYSKPFEQRCSELRNFSSLEVLKQHKLTSIKQVDELYQEIISNGGEGLILRDPNGKYKHGRSTLREQWMLKLKQFNTLDGTVIGFRPLKRLIEGAAKKLDNFGKLKRSNKKEDYYESEELGALEVQLKDGRLVDVGSGFNSKGGDLDRKVLWNMRDTLIGKGIEIKCTEVGSKDKPMLPVFIRWRE